MNAYGIVSILGTHGTNKATVGTRLVVKSGGVKDPDGVDYSKTSKNIWYRGGVEVWSSGDTDVYVVTNDDMGYQITAAHHFYDKSGNEEVVWAENPVFVTDEHIEVVKSLYPYAFNRSPDREGLLFWAKYLRGMSEPDPIKRLEKLMYAFRTSPTYNDEF